MSAGKVLKTIAFTATSQEAHVSMKIKNVLKWLKTGHEVRVNIQGKEDRKKSMEAIFAQIQKEVRDGADVKQKVVRADAIKFSLKPTPAAAKLALDETEQTEDDLDALTSGKDILSEEFERELLQSIEEDKKKKR